MTKSLPLAVLALLLAAPARAGDCSVRPAEAVLRAGERVRFELRPGGGSFTGWSRDYWAPSARRPVPEYRAGLDAREIDGPAIQAAGDGVFVVERRFVATGGRAVERPVITETFTFQSGSGLATRCQVKIRLAGGGT